MDREQLKAEIEFFFIMGILIFLFIAVLSLFSGCAVAPTDPAVTNPSAHSPYDRRDLRLKINDLDVVGYAVAPRSSKYQIKVYPESSIDRIIWTTCNRQEVIDKPSNGFWGDLEGDHSYRFDLDPVSGLEDMKACALEITVLTQKQNRTGFAFVDFNDGRPEFQQIAGSVKCNGTERKNTGVLVCQSAENLIQEIDFDREVIPGSPDVGCEPMKAIDGSRLKYRWKLSAGQCTYLFGSKDGSRFRLTAIGYNEVPFRR